MSLALAADLPPSGVEVQDSGAGVDDKDLDRMFPALYTTKAEALGMGLTIARTIVEAHGGR